jgi:hypothetical protein
MFGGVSLFVASVDVVDIVFKSHDVDCLLYRLFKDTNFVNEKGDI